MGPSLAHVLISGCHGLISWKGIRGISNNTWHSKREGVWDSATKWHKGEFFSKVSCDIFLRISKQNLLVLTTSWATFKYEIKQKFVWLKISQIKLTLAGLGFHIKLEMIKLQNVTPHGGGEWSVAVSPNVTWGGRGTKMV
jgi:hypothetical protein